MTLTLDHGDVKPSGHKQQHTKYESDRANGSRDIARTRCVTDGQMDDEGKTNMSSPGWGRHNLLCQSQKKARADLWLPIISEAEMLIGVQVGFPGVEFKPNSSTRFSK